MTDQLPATVLPGTLALKADIRLVPGLIADAGEQAGWRYIEFFTATIRPLDVAVWVEGMQERHSAPGVNRQVSA